MPEKPTPAPTGIALVGAGGWGQYWLAVLAEHPGVELRWVCDPGIGRTGVVGPRHSPDLEPVLADPRTEAVIIATPPETHMPLAERALLAGKHVCVEKPFTTCASDAHTLVELSQRLGRVLMVNHLLAHHPAFERLADEVGRGAWGNLRAVLGQRHSVGSARTDCPLWSLAPHDLSLLYRLAPQLLPKLKVQHHGVFRVLSAETPVRCRLNFSVNAGRKRRRFACVTDRALVDFDDLQESKLRVYPGVFSLEEALGFWQQERVPSVGQSLAVSAEPPLTRALCQFIQSIGGEPVKTGAAEGLAVVQTLERLTTCSQEHVVLAQALAG